MLTSVAVDVVVVYWSGLFIKARSTKQQVSEGIGPGNVRRDQAGHLHVW